MSITAAAIRLSAVRAIRGATLAGDRVYDSVIDPIDETIKEEAKPVITISTDDEDGKLELRELLLSDRVIDFIIEIAVAQQVDVTIPAEDGGGTAQIINIPHTDAGLELILNLMWRQTSRALLAGDNQWSGLWRVFVDKIENVTIRRGVSSEKGARFAARQIKMSIKPMMEPPFQPITAGSVWDNFIAALAANGEDDAKVSKLLKSEIESPNLPDWRQVAADLGLANDGAAAIGIGPVVEDPAANEPTPPLSEATLHLSDDVSFKANEQTIGEQLPGD